MLPNGKKHACQNVPLDLLNSLPENIIDDILICLLLRDAVRTRILSSKWRYKWCRISELEFDEILRGETTEKIPLTIKFTNIIYHLLSFLAGPISKFVLSIKLENCPEIDKLIYFLSRNDIQQLDLKFSTFGQCKLSSSIFTCSQLRHLFLNNCSIPLAPPTFKGFDRLISLELCRVTISSKLLESLISNCPLLDELELSFNDFSDVIEINAPILRSFEFAESEGSICLKSVSRLAKLSLWHKNYHVGTRNCFESFYYLEHLELIGHSIKFLVAAAREVPTKLPFFLNCLKHLRLEDIYLDQVDLVLYVLFLITSFQYLEYLEIQVVDEMKIFQHYNVLN